MPKDMLGRGADRDNPLQIDMGNRSGAAATESGT